MKELIHQADPNRMNWVEGHTEWGTVRVPDGISAEVTTEQRNDVIVEHYTFTNTSETDIFTYLKDISIYIPFNDNYESADVCLKCRCHTHIFCGENIAYVMALRMGGEAPHLGLVLTEGSIGGYSVERDISESSNDRGDFMLHPSPVALVPGQKFTVSWVLFWHNGKQDFYEKVKQYNPNFIDVQANQFVLLGNERAQLTIRPAFAFNPGDVSITADRKEVHYEVHDGEITVNEQPARGGEIRFDIDVKGVHTHCNLFVLPAFAELLQKRCEFIVRNQQYCNPKSGLDGAYLAYDNEEKHIYYNHVYDYDGGRERVAMGILIAKYLQIHPNAEFEKSLKKYTEYVERELFDRETGVVYNDYHRNNRLNRLYNYSWVSIFYLELYRLYHNQQHLLYAYRAMKSFYEQGGTQFYAFPIPLTDLVVNLEKAGYEEEKKCILAYFRQHSAFIMQNGLNYPPHEVKYEQSIVFPATSILLQMYEVTKEPKYLDAAQCQLRTLELFNGLQPDCHLYEVAIRHWDGRWFGKRKLYGDTFPHYWSSLTGIAYADYARLANRPEYRKKAEFSLRASLGLFRPDGTASCAYVYPASVNGIDAGFYDPLANDQDWALYFMLCFKMGDGAPDGPICNS